MVEAAFVMQYFTIRLKLGKKEKRIPLNAYKPRFRVRVQSFSVLGLGFEDRVLLVSRFSYMFFFSGEISRLDPRFSS